VAGHDSGKAKYCKRGASDKAETFPRVRRLRLDDARAQSLILASAPFSACLCESWGKIVVHWPHSSSSKVGDAAGSYRICDQRVSNFRLDQLEIMRYLFQLSVANVGRARAEGGKLSAARKIA
jgi:hypothetical protein